LRIASVYQSIGKADLAKAELDMAKRLPLRSDPSLQEMIDSIEIPTP
jgi:hypothetical protein